MFHRSFALLLFKSPVVKITDFFFLSFDSNESAKNEITKIGRDLLPRYIENVE